MRSSPNKSWLDSTIKAYVDTYGVTESPLVFDVGSRDGHSGYEIARRISNGVIDHSNIVLFECNPPSQEVIKRNYPKATLVKDAVSDKSGKTVEFVQMKGNENIVGSSSMDLNRIKESWLKDYEIIKVKTKRIDEIIEELGLQDMQIDVVKIDVEHYSYEALKSMGSYLRNARVVQVETEIAGYARAETNLDIALYMENMGYKLVDIFYEYPPNIEDHVYIRVG